MTRVEGLEEVKLALKLAHFSMFQNKSQKLVPFLQCFALFSGTPTRTGTSGLHRSFSGWRRLAFLFFVCIVAF